jgi:hypothetical protein
LSFPQVSDRKRTQPLAVFLVAGLVEIVGGCQLWRVKISLAKIT